MTGQEIQARIDALVTDLQTKGKGQTINVMVRNPNNSPQILPLSSDANGVVNAAQLTAIDNFFGEAIDLATDLTALSAPVTAAGEAFRLAQVPHEGLIEAARAARAALNDALANDAAYQAAKTALDAARSDPNYIAVSEQFQAMNVSENYAALARAKGEYIV